MALETYQPSTIPNARWEAICDFTVSLGQQYRDLHPEIAYNRYMPVLARLIDVVCNRDGYAQDIEVVLDAEMIEMMIRDELEDLSVHSRGVYKTTLRRLGEALNPSWMGQTIYKKHARTTSQPPYTPAEITDVLDWCVDTDEFISCERRKIVGLGLGAGLTSRQMSELKWSSVEVDERGVLIHLPDRTIPVTARWVYLLDLDKAGRDEYVLRPNVTSREPDDVTGRTARNKVESGMRPDIRRLKATWIVDLMNRYVPDAFICHAAGIKSLKRYEQYRPDLGDEDLMAVRGLFHGDGRAEGLRVV